MRKQSMLVAVVGGVALLASCTGDPTRGGIFWSEQKAQERVIALQNEEAMRQGVLIEKQEQQNQLLKRKADLQRQLNKARQSNDNAEINSLKKRISELEHQISILKR